MNCITYQGELTYKQGLCSKVFKMQLEADLRSKNRAPCCGSNLHLKHKLFGYLFENNVIEVIGFYFIFLPNSNFTPNLDCKLKQWIKMQQKKWMYSKKIKLHCWVLRIFCHSPSHLLNLRAPCNELCQSHKTLKTLKFCDALTVLNYPEHSTYFVHTRFPSYVLYHCTMLAL